jgi:hypothetical protein
VADDESLMDVFVRVLPHPDNDDVVKAAADKTKAMFSQIAGGTVGPGAARATDELKRGFIEAKRYAEDLAREAASLFRTVKATGDTDISARFRDAMQELKRAQIDLARGNQDADPFALDRTLERLDQVRAKMREAGGEGLRAFPSSQRIRDDFAGVIESERQNRSEFNIDTNLKRQFDKGLNFAQKEEIAILIANVQKAEVAFDSLGRTFKRTSGDAQAQADQLNRLNQAARNLTEARQAVEDTFKTRPPGSRSTNALSNNAYQLGQAFEDASVGFQLNGFAGAVRGSANNIAFILNDLSRMEAVQARLGAGWANALPLIAGIGSGLAIVVLPKMIEWLQSLYEVEFKLKDIGEQIKRNVENAEFKVGLSIGSEGFGRQVSQAKSLEEIISKTNDLLVKQDENLQKINATSGALEKSGAFTRGSDDISTAFQVAVRSRDQLEQKIKTIREQAQSLPGGIFGIGPTEKELADLKRNEEGVRLLANASQDLDKVQRATKSGSDTLPKDILKAAESFSLVTQELDRAKSETDGIFSAISKENAEALKKSLSEIGVELDKINKLAIEAAEIQSKNLVQGLDAIIDKNKELAFGIKLAQAEIKGLTFEGASKIDEIFLKNDRVREDISELILKALQQDDPATRAKALEAADAANETQSGLLRNDLERLLKKSKDELKKLEERDKSSTFTNFEDFSKKLQTNVLKSDTELIKSQNHLKQQITVLTEAIRLEDQNFAKNGGRFFPLSDRGADANRAEQLEAFRSGFKLQTPQEQAANQAAAFEQALRVLMPPLFQLVDSQNKTTEAVKQVPGAVAQ